MGDAPTSVHPNDWVAERLAGIDQIADALKQVKALVDLASELLPSPSKVVQEALTAALAIKDKDLSDKVYVLSKILSYLPKVQQQEVIQPILEIAQSLDNSDALRPIVSHLYETQQQDILHRVLKSIAAVEDSSKGIHLNEFISNLPELPINLLHEALTIAESIDDTYWKAEALDSIAPRIPESAINLLQKALSIAHSIEHMPDKAISLSAIAPRLPATQRHDVFEEAIFTIESIQPSELRMTFLDGEVKNTSAKAAALAVISSHLSKFATEQFQKVLAIAQSLENSLAKVKALKRIALSLPEPQQQEMLQQVFIAAQSFKGLPGEAQALIEIALYLPESQQQEVVQQALTAAQSLEISHKRAKALSEVAPYLPISQQQEVLQQVLITVKLLEDSHQKANVLIAVASRLPKFSMNLLQQALTAAESLENKIIKKADILSSIASRLPQFSTDLFSQTLTAARSFDSLFIEAYALSGIAPHLPESQQQSIFQKALSIAQSIQEPGNQKKALREVSPYLPKIQRYELDLQRDQPQAFVVEEPCLPEKQPSASLQQIPKVTQCQDTYPSTDRSSEVFDSLAEVCKLEDQAIQITLPDLKVFLETTLNLPDPAWILISPASRLTEHFISLLPRKNHLVALEIVRRLSNQKDQVKFLSALIPNLFPGRFSEVLNLIKSQFVSDRFRAEALNNLLPYLPKDELLSALDLIIHTITNPYHQTSILENLIPLLNSQHFGVVLGLVEKLTHPQLKARVLGSIATVLGAETIGAVSDRVDTRVLPKLDNINSALHDYVVDRPYLIARTFALTQKLKEYQGSDFSYESAVSSIFSQLAPVLHYLNKDQLERGLTSVQQLEDPGYQAAVLIALGSFYPEFVKEHLPSFQGDDYRTLLNLKILLALPDELNSEALTTTLGALQGECCKAEALAEISSYPAGKGFQTEALRAIRGLTNAYLQAQYLERFIPNLEERQRFESASIIGDISDPYHRVSARVALARRFPGSEFFNAALDDALQLTSRVQQIEQLSTLAIDMPELLPRIIEIAEELDIDPQTVGIEDSKAIEEEAFATKIERRDVLVALAPHLPMRINREVNRECALGHSISPELYHRALYLLARGYRDALQGGTLRNDAAQDRDLLDLKDEVNALSGLLLMRDLEPPMTVGILGGWGGGKSYIMHLMQAQMTAIRSRKVDVDVEAWNANPNHEKLSPYVGHIYQIKFDAWTFAKSDLWASLMQTIFFELNRQISLEQQLARVLADNPEDATSRAKVLCEAGQYWPVLYKASEQDRQWFLERVLSPDQLAKFKAIHNQGQVDDELWRQLGDTYQTENQKLEKLEAELHHKQDELKNKKQDIRSQVDGNKLNQLILKLTGPVSIILSNRISAPVLQQINKDITHQVKAQLSSQAAADALEPLDSEHLKATVQAVAAGVFEHRYGEISFRSFLTWFQKNLRLFGLMLGFLTLAILLPIAADTLMGWLLPGIDSVFPRLIAFLAPLTPGIASAQALLKSSQKWVEETNLAVKEYEQQLETLPQQLEERREQLFQNQLEKVTEVADLEAEVKLLEEKVNAQRQRIPKNVYESLEAFVSDRIQDGSYEKRLGLMQQVKGDLAELSNRLLPPPADSQEFQWKVEQLQKVFPRGPARVVVYIDDLDRCPPDRVVQVLEAVQLLVKTPLFIAVLAIDERYITRALEQFYKGVLLRHGSPSGTDYLEKIIQLPYRVRPIMANSLETYLRSQVVIQDNATGGTKFSEFSRQEFKMLVDCCQQVDLSPRTLKRLTNVYKLFKIVCRTRGTKTTPQVQQAILALLALSGRYPNLMRGVFEVIETCFEEQRDETKAHDIDCDNAKQLGIDVSQLKLKSLHLDTPLKDFFINCQSSTHDQYLHLELGKLQHDALKTDILPRTLTLRDITHEIFNLIRSFSFVGEIGEDPDDYRFNSQP